MNMQESMSKFKEACRDLQDAGTRVAETKRKADDAQDLIRAHRECCRRVSAEYGTAKKDLNECLGRMRPAHARHCRGNTCDRHAVPLTEIPMKYGTYKKLWT